MAKDLNPTIAEIIGDETRADCPAPSEPGVLLGFASAYAFDPEAVITQMLENNVGVLDNLRQTAAGADKRGASEVRLHGHPASVLLTGFEDSISYFQLVAVIDTMKAGIARRRVAALT